MLILSPSDKTYAEYEQIWELRHGIINHFKGGFIFVRGLSLNGLILNKKILRLQTSPFHLCFGFGWRRKSRLIQLLMGPRNATQRIVAPHHQKLPSAPPRK
jgi:hypothetical protein